MFTLDDIIPVPCNPDTLAMGYALKTEDRIVPLTRYLDSMALLRDSNNTIVFERNRTLKDGIFELFSTRHSPHSRSASLRELLCCLPRLSVPEDLSYENVFRILIVQFMDATNLDIRALKKSCIHIATPEGNLIPFETYNLFYRDEHRSRLEKIRDTIRLSMAAKDLT